MGSSVYADNHTYEVLREFAHRKRKKITRVLKDAVVDLENQLKVEYGVTIDSVQDTPKAGKK